MEDHGDWKRIGQLSLLVAVSYFAAAAALTPSIEGTVLPLALEAFASVTAPLYSFGSGAWAGHATRFFAFAVLAAINLLALSPLLVAPASHHARLCLATVASASIAACSYLLADMPAWLAFNSLAALVVGAIVLHWFQPNNSSKPTPLRGAA